MAEQPTRISYLPTDGLSYRPAEPVYWDAAALSKEIDRVFEVCQGCRLCFKYCDVFPSLFALVDRSYGGDVRKITDVETDALLGQCFQCKLCEVHCPYTPRDGHEFQVDFPRLVHRHQAVKARAKKPSLGDRVLADPDRTAGMARKSFGLANVLNRVGLHRWFLEKVLGVHRKKWLPNFARKTFEGWATEQGHVAKEPGGEAVLFQTCYVQHNEPEIGRDTVEVMQHNGVDLRCAKGLRCCGMPSWEIGDLEGVRAKAKANLDVLEPFVNAGAKVIAINPTCSMMMRREWPQLVADEDRERAQKAAAAVRDPSEYLWSIRKEDRFRTDFRSSPGEKVAYHAPCHLRAQAVGFRGRSLLAKIPGVETETTLECCGHDGTYAMKRKGFEASQRIGKRAFESVKSEDAEVWVTDCPLAALQFAQHAGKKPMHPMSVLARAYRADGFPHPVHEPKDEAASE